MSRMMNWLLGLDLDGPITNLTVALRMGWPGLVVLLLVLAAVGYACLLYFRERALKKRKRVLLACLRAAMYALIVLLLMEPALSVQSAVKLRRNVLVLVDVSDSMNIADVRRTPAEIESAAKALGLMPYDSAAFVVTETIRAQAAKADRLKMAQAVLSKVQPAIFEKLGQDYAVHYFTFGDELRPIASDTAAAPRELLDAKAADKTTRLGDAISKAVDSFSGRPLAGVVVITDGASNEGLEPLKIAGRMKERAVPLYMVGMGLPNPPDVKLVGPVVSDVVFVEDKAPVRVQVVSKGYTSQPAAVTLSLDGKEVEKKTVVLNGETQFVELTLAPKEKSPAAKLEVAVQRLDGEVTHDNNRVTKTVRIIDDKIKVLYVEGKPRWEYRYLRRVLLRDHRLDVKFLMTEGDRELARASDEYITEFPLDARKAFDFDMVIVGDVPSSYFSRAQIERIREMVDKHKGSLLMLGGRDHNPASYIGTPLEDLLPVKLTVEPRLKLREGVTPKVTEDGFRSAVATLEVPEEKNQQVWSVVKPLYTVPAVAGAKAGATVLVELSESPLAREVYPLVAWQRFGGGKTMLVATDDLWRLRYKTGDKYHARFWGQAIQFLTLAKVLGGNQRVTIETDQSTYRQGQRVTVAATVLDDAYAPANFSHYTVKIMGDDAAQMQTLRLEPVAGMPGAFQGFYSPSQPGRLKIGPQPKDKDIANIAEIEVEATSLERLEPGMQEGLLKKMAELADGRFYTADNVVDLLKAIAGEQRVMVVRKEISLWDHWPVLVGLLMLATVEWVLRRRSDLI